MHEHASVDNAEGNSLHAQLASGIFPDARNAPANLRPVCLTDARRVLLNPALHRENNACGTGNVSDGSLTGASLSLTVAPAAYLETAVGEALNIHAASASFEYCKLAFSISTH